MEMKKGYGYIKRLHIVHTFDVFESLSTQNCFIVHAHHMYMYFFASKTIQTVLTCISFDESVSRAHWVKVPWVKLDLFNSNVPKAKSAEFTLLFERKLMAGTNLGQRTSTTKNTENAAFFYSF